MKKEKNKDIFYEAGHALVWAKFEEKGCPLTEKQAEKENNSLIF